MHTATHLYHHNDQTLNGHLAFDNTTPKKRPGVLVFHDWSGCNDFAKKQAETLAEMGYVGLAADLYGDGRAGKTTDEKKALMTPLVEDRAYLLERIKSAFNTLLDRPEVDQTHVAAIGFCFGGLCALDLARSGAALSGIVSFHGLLNRSESTPITPIQSKLLVLHGYDDPMVPPEQVHTFCDEMTKANADWQLHMYGQTTHAFTNPDANDPVLGTKYNALTSHRAFQSMNNFLTDLFAESA
ncbi:MAG: dienelactone hydrolase family protein [Gammaproteobacteria bacterium]|nr:dienelactone hydrolase family protein [Gammaproteobacteria bacterium]